MIEEQPRPVPVVPPPRTSRLLIILGILLALLVVPYLSEQIQYHITRGREQARRDVARAELKEFGEKAELVPLSQYGSVFQDVALSVGPAVVHIDTRQVTGGTKRRMGEFSIYMPRQLREGQGSGVIVETENGRGYIVTNHHVVAGATEIQVKLSDGRVITDVEKLGDDPATDLAVLKITAEGLTSAGWGDSETLDVGHWVLAIGNPYGLDRTVTAGIVSAKRRRKVVSGEIRYQDFLQTDAAVNPGNSGGPLVNLRGEVVGINTAIVGQAYQGISFAIPSGIARDVYEDLKFQRPVVRGFLGVQPQDITPELAERLGVSPGNGVLVSAVVPDSPADQAAIQESDVIVSINGEPVSDAPGLALIVAQTDVGSEAEVVLIRGGQERTLKVKIGQLP